MARKKRLASLDERKQYMLDHNVHELAKNIKFEVPNGPIHIKKVYMTPEERAAGAYKG